MNILIYAPVINQESGGIIQYSTGILDLITKDTENTFYIFHNSIDDSILKILNNYPHLHPVTDHDIHLRGFSSFNRYAIRLYNKFARRFDLKLKKHKTELDKLCKKLKIEIIHCPFQYLPQVNNVKLITTLHDVQEIHFPEYFTPEERAWRANNYLDFLRQSDIVIVSYLHVKNDLMKYFNVPEDKIRTLLLPMHNNWFSKFSDDDIVELNKFGFKEKFLLYPANTWKHKNHIRLIEAVDLIRKQFHLSVNIVCTGHLNENYKEIKQKIESLNLENQFVFTGIINEQELFSTYEKCYGVVIPTTYEAGSFPLYESILLNKPVICSNVTSLPETIGADEYTFNPFNIEEIANKIVLLWSSIEYREMNLLQLRKQAEIIKENNPLPYLQFIYQQLKHN